MILNSFCDFHSGTKYPITFDSSPQGATLKCGSKNIGYTPQTLRLSPEKYKEIPSHMNECSAIWSSGYTKKYGWFSTTKFPDGVTQTVERPIGEGYTQDVEFTLKVANMNTQKRQAAAAESAAVSAKYYNSYYNKKSNSKSKTPKACSKFGDLSGRVYYFEDDLCPFGYF